MRLKRQGGKLISAVQCTLKSERHLENKQLEIDCVSSSLLFLLTVTLQNEANESYQESA